MRLLYRSSGFAIIEFVIVLIVVGLITSAAIKGKALMDTAMLKQEMNKIRKLEKALNIWLRTHTDIHETGRFSDINMQELYDMGIVSQDELISELGSGSFDGDNALAVWTPAGCQEVDMGEYTLFEFTNASFPNTGISYCARLLTVASEGKLSGYMTTIHYPLSFQCIMELTLDDENVTTGDARRIITNKMTYDPTNFTQEEYADCIALDKKSGSTEVYLSGKEMSNRIYSPAVTEERLTIDNKITLK